MPENISTYWAREVKLKSYLADKFDFILKIKNSDGSDYNFSDTTKAFFGVFKRTVNPIGAVLSNYNSDFVTAFDTLVEDGRISVFNSDPSGYLAEPGTYHYILFCLDNLSNLNHLVSKVNHNVFLSILKHVFQYV